MTHKTSSVLPTWIALGTSVIFSPFVVPIVTAIFVIQKYASTINEIILWLAVVLTFVTALPILAIVVLLRFSKVSDLHLHAKEERLIPLCFTLISMILGTIVLYQIGANERIIWVCQAYIVNSVVFSIITPLWKISFHTSAATGCIIVLSLLVNLNLVWLFLLIPLIAWARVYREKHTLMQTVAGTLLAIVNTMLFYHFLPPSG
jgi:membrane-associated phospholipid phosphatase